MTFFIFHLDISGNDFNDMHSENKLLISSTLFVSQFEISGIDLREVQLSKIHLKSEENPKNRKLFYIPHGLFA